jgi:hypothetical protein
MAKKIGGKRNKMEKLQCKAIHLGGKEEMELPLLKLAETR